MPAIPTTVRSFCSLVCLACALTAGPLSAQEDTAPSPMVTESPSAPTTEFPDWMNEEDGTAAAAGAGSGANTTHALREPREPVDPDVGQQIPIAGPATSTRHLQFKPPVPDLTRIRQAARQRTRQFMGPAASFTTQVSQPVATAPSPAPIVNLGSTTTAAASGTTTAGAPPTAAASAAASPPLPQVTDDDERLIAELATPTETPPATAAAFATPPATPAPPPATAMAGRNPQRPHTFKWREPREPSLDAIKHLIESGANASKTWHPKSGVRRPTPPSSLLKERQQHNADQ